MTQPSVPTSLTLRLKHVEQIVRRHLERALRGEKLTFEQWQILSALLEQPGLRMTELSALAALPAATVTRHVDHLVGHALVIRRVDPDDKRRVVAALSSRGSQIARGLRDLELDVEVQVPLGTEL